MTTNLTLLTDARHSEEDIYAYEWEDLADGLITNEHGSIIKLLCDQMNEHDIVLLIEPMSGTGKTAKFIIDNIETPANVPNIVTQDVFQNTFLYCGEFFEIVEDNPKVFQNTITPDTIAYNMAGEVEGVTKHYEDADDLYIDLNVDPPIRTKQELGLIIDKSYSNMANMLNFNGDALDQEHVVFEPTLIVLFPFPISLGYPVHEAEGLVGQCLSSLHRLPIGGVLVLIDIHYEKVNTQMWRALDCMKDEHAYQFECEWLLGLNPDGTTGVHKAAAIKRIA